MNGQLFDPDQPTARTTDPTTAAPGLDVLGRNRHCAEVLVIIAAAGERGATCADILAHLPATADRGNVARRVTDLRQRGLITRDGTTRIARTGGRPQQVNRITAEGRAALIGARVLLEQAAA